MLSPLCHPQTQTFLPLFLLSPWHPKCKVSLGATLCRQLAIGVGRAKLIARKAAQYLPAQSHLLFCSIKPIDSRARAERGSDYTGPFVMMTCF